MSKEMARWSLTTLREKLVKIGARLTRHARRLTVQMAEVAIPRDLFAGITQIKLGVVSLWAECPPICNTGSPWRPPAPSSSAQRSS